MRGQANVSTPLCVGQSRRKKERKKGKVGFAGGKESMFDNWVAFPSAAPLRRRMTSRPREFIRGPRSFSRRNSSIARSGNKLGATY